MGGKIISEVENYLTNNAVYLQTAKKVESLIGRRAILDYPAFLTRPREGTIISGSGFLKENGCDLHNFLGQDENGETGTIADRVYEFISREPRGDLSKIYFSPKVVEVNGNIYVRANSVEDLRLILNRSSEAELSPRGLDDGFAETHTTYGDLHRSVSGYNVRQQDDFD